MATRPGRYGASSHRGAERSLKTPKERRRTETKGSTRPDDRIQAEIRDRLGGEPQLNAATIDVMVENGEVTLSGAVADKWGLDRAQALAARTSGVKTVRNALRVELHGVGTVGNSTPSNPNSTPPKE